MVKHLALLVLGGRVLYTHFGSQSPGAPGLIRRVAEIGPRVVRVSAAQLILLAAFWLAGSWSTYFTLWLLPLMTLAVLFNGLRAFCDHANLTDHGSDEAHRLVSYISTPIERFFLAPFHMNFHAEHHLFPYVPHYRLPTLRRQLMGSREFAETIQWRRGYLLFAREFLLAQKRRLSPAA